MVLEYEFSFAENLHQCFVSGIKIPAIIITVNLIGLMKFPEVVFPDTLRKDTGAYSDIVPEAKRRRHAITMVKIFNEFAKRKQRDNNVAPNLATALGEVSTQPHFLGRELTQRRIFYLRTLGCTWSRAIGGGCTMCGHLGGMDVNGTFTDEQILSEFREAFHRYDYSDTKVVAIYNGGSLLSSSEINPGVRDEIIRTVASEPNVELIIFESLAELATPGRLSAVRKAAADKRLQIGVGFESIDDDIRYLCVNKRNSLQDYRTAFSNMRAHDIEPLAYCLMKPIFLNEREAIEDTIRTVHFALENDVSAVSVEPISVQDDTLVDLLHSAGLYRTPWTWSLLEVIRQTHGWGEVRAGGFELFPRPREYVHNCKHCDEQCYDALRHYNATCTVEHFDSLHCSCQNEWEHDVNQPESDNFIDRVLSHLKIVSEITRPIASEAR